MDVLYAEWGHRYFVRKQPRDADLFAACVAAAGLESGLIEAADDESWDEPIRKSMEVAYAFCGEKTQTPAIVVRSDPPHGFKGPVMAPAPTGPAALQLWDAIQVLSEHHGFFELTRPRIDSPHRYMSD